MTCSSQTFTTMAVIITIATFRPRVAEAITREGADIITIRTGNSINQVVRINSRCIISAQDTRSTEEANIIKIKINRISSKISRISKTIQTTNNKTSNTS